MSELVARLRNRMLNILAGPRPSLDTDELEQKVRRVITKYRGALEEIVRQNRGGHYEMHQDPPCRCSGHIARRALANQEDNDD